MKKILVVFIILYLFTFLSARDFKFGDIRKTIVLKDGSVLYGKINLEKCTKDSISFSTKYLKNAMIDKRGVKFFGSNLNSGIMFGILPFYNFSAGKDYKLIVPFISSLSTFNANVSSGLDFIYFSKEFEKDSEKYLYPNSAEENGELISGNFKYNGKFLVPTYIFRINVIPDTYKYKLDRANVYPYIGLGAGFDFGWVKYNITDVDSVMINQQMYDINDIKSNNHMFLGINYKFTVGVSYKIMDRITTVFEVIYYNDLFKQSLTDTEDNAKMKREKFTSKGFGMTIGFRFGKF